MSPLFTPSPTTSLPQFLSQSAPLTIIYCYLNTCNLEFPRRVYFHFVIITAIKILSHIVIVELVVAVVVRYCHCQHRCCCCCCCYRRCHLVINMPMLIVLPDGLDLLAGYLFDTTGLQRNSNNNNGFIVVICLRVWMLACKAQWSKKTEQQQQQINGYFISLSIQCPNGRRLIFAIGIWTERVNIWKIFKMSWNWNP